MELKMRVATVCSLMLLTLLLSTGEKANLCLRNPITFTLLSYFLSSHTHRPLVLSPPCDCGGKSCRDLDICNKPCQQLGYDVGVCEPMIARCYCIKDRTDQAGSPVSWNP
ncbi:unnamed protein product [Spirodela intermedia]|uniref:Uncharacterized protein n=1 Tax=Spirodela intermedia TaxID=51605 RepID=A0A7I8KAE1_SPIIN|nr:unnamed protein product [Spirodela intermedia]